MGYLKTCTGSVSVYHQKLFKLCLTLDDSLFLQFKKQNKGKFLFFGLHRVTFTVYLIDILTFCGSTYTANNYRRALILSPNKLEKYKLFAANVNLIYAICVKLSFLNESIYFPHPSTSLLFTI